ncbi:MAG: RNA methyltransferase, partial [Anaerovorax sp.]
MNQITSSENKWYKNVAKLNRKKYRDLFNEYVIEGPNLLREALVNEANLKRVFFKRSLPSQEGRTEMKRILEELEKKQVEIYAVEDKLFEKLADTETTQGVIGVVEKQKEEQSDFFQRRWGKGGNLIVLDRIQDPGNLGTILRTADGAGFSGAIVMKGTTDVYGAKVVRAATGSLFRLPILQVDTPESCLRLLRENGKVSVCAALEGAVPYFECDMKENTAIIIGNEGNGASTEFIK